MGWSGRCPNPSPPIRPPYQPLLTDPRPPRSIYTKTRSGSVSIQSQSQSQSQFQFSALKPQTKQPGQRPS